MRLYKRRRKVSFVDYFTDFTSDDFNLEYVSMVFCLCYSFPFCWHRLQVTSVYFMTVWCWKKKVMKLLSFLPTIKLSVIHMWNFQCFGWIFSGSSSASGDERVGRDGFPIFFWAYCGNFTLRPLSHLHLCLCKMWRKPHFGFNYMYNYDIFYQILLYF
jgi:hypothetical protein